MKSISVLSVLVLSLMNIACSEGLPPLPPGPRTVDTFDVDKVSVIRERSLVGEIRATDRSELSFEIGGLIRSVNVRLDSTFKAGDVIAELDSETLKLNVQSRKSDLKGANARLHEATLNFERVNGLQEFGAVSQAIVDAAKARMESTEAETQVLNSELSRAKENLSFAQISAPYDGRVSQRLVEPGQVIRPGQPVVLITHNGKGVEALVNVPEKLRNILVPGKAVEVSLAGKNESVAGEVIELGFSASPSGLYPAVVRLNGTPELQPGSQVRVSFTTHNEKRSLRIPFSSILAQDNNRLAVWRLTENNTLKKQFIELEKLEGKWALVSNGLNQGDRIISRGAELLRENETVTPVRSEPLKYNP